MTEPLRPDATKVYGRENWIIVPAVSGYATGTGPTVAEVTGASSLDVTRIVFADGVPEPGQTTNLVEQKKRLGDTTSAQFVGDTTYSGGELTYAFNPQGATGSDGVKLWEKIKDGGPFFLIRRMGLGRAVTPAAGQFVDVYKVEFGPSKPTKSGDAEAGEAAAMCTFAITDPNPVFKTAILA